ncbi:hypothetical protein TRVL_05252 [Trypanosoma vivax]|nr:hypothetical protein TRVL_05252 [Trypanosoma vivax]
MVHGRTKEVQYRGTARLAGDCSRQKSLAKCDTVQLVATGAYELSSAHLLLGEWRRCTIAALRRLECNTSWMQWHCRETDRVCGSSNTRRACPSVEHCKSLLLMRCMRIARIHALCCGKRVEAAVRDSARRAQIAETTHDRRRVLRTAGYGNVKGETV